LGTIQVTDPINTPIRNTLAPVTYAINKIKVQANNEVITLVQARTIANKYKALNEQNLQLRHEVAQLKLLKEENARLREQMNAPGGETFKLIPAKVIAKDMGLTIVYDKTDKVQKGAVVIIKNNFIGLIEKATDRSATVTLVTDPKIQMPAIIINDANETIKGVAVGQFGTGIMVDRIEQNYKIQKGNVVTLDKTPRSPPGIIIGEIVEIQKIESELFQRAIVRPLINFDTFDTVFIMQ
jgi:rod shape-determining protein MreC